MSVTVTSLVTLFPRCHGMRVSPSGRFPSVRNSHGGSRTDGVLALVSARYDVVEFVMSYGLALLLILLFYNCYYYYYYCFLIIFIIIIIIIIIIIYCYYYHYYYFI